LNNAFDFRVLRKRGEHPKESNSVLDGKFSAYHNIDGFRLVKCNFIIN